MTESFNLQAFHRSWLGKLPVVIFFPTRAAACAPWVVLMSFF
jgi:hypothetical protein